MRKSLQSRRINISVFLEHLYDAAAQTDQPLESMLEFIRGLGIGGVETDFLRLREDPALPELLSKNGIEISCVYAQFDFSHSSDVSGALQVLDVLHENGVKLFMPIPGFCAPEDDREVCLARMLSCMERVIQAAEERGIAVCMEDYDDSAAIYSTAEGLNDFLTALPKLGCAFDTGNFCYSEENELEAFERMRDRITHLHCKDRSRVQKRPSDEEKISLGGSSLYPAAVGEGIIGIEKIVKELVRSGYHGWFAVEHFGSASQLEDIRNSVENLRRWEDDLCNGLE